MQSIPPSAEERAVCSLHPKLGAVFTCERCGSFGCEACRSPSQPSLCQVCTQRVELVGELTVRALLQDSFRLLGRNPSGVGLILGIQLLGSSVSTLFPNLDSEGWIYFLISCSFSSFATGAFLSWTAAGLLQPSRRSLLSALGVGLLRLPYLLPMLGLFLHFASNGSLLIYLPLSYLAVCLCLAPALVVLDRLELMESVRLSYQLTRGYRWTLLAVLSVSPLLQFAWMFFSQWAGLTFFPELQAFSWLWVGLFSMVYAFCSALHYCAVVLAWMRLTGRVPSP